MSEIVIATQANTIVIEEAPDSSLVVQPIENTLVVQPINQIVVIQIASPGFFSGDTNVENFPFSRNVVTVSTGGTPWVLDGYYEWESATLGCGTAPTGADIILDINKNGTSIFTNQANRPRIVAGQLVGTMGVPDILTFSPGDVLRVDIDQIGSVLPGANLAMPIRLRRMAA